MRKSAGAAAMLLTAAMIFMAACSSVQSGLQVGMFRSEGGSGGSGAFGGGSGGSGASGGGGSTFGGRDSGGTSTAPERNYEGASQTVPWPSDSDWGRYGLAGLRQPPGVDVTAAALYQGAYHVALINGGRPAFENLRVQIENMPGAELITDVNSSDGRMVGYSLRGGSVQIAANFVDGDIVITASK
jgi:hypothetical protein